jgi:cation-transporting ATPase 13A2
LWYQRVGRAWVNQKFFLCLTIEDSHGASPLFPPCSIKERCLPASVPVDFESQLQSLALNGDRVLACAYRAFPSTATTLDPLLRSPRPEMETGLTFAGFLVMENKLKPETAGVLQKLTAAGLRQVMVTGDNPLTAVAVARCGHLLSGGAEVDLKQEGTEVGRPSDSTLT